MVIQISIPWSKRRTIVFCAQRLRPEKIPECRHPGREHHQRAEQQQRKDDEVSRRENQPQKHACRLQHYFVGPPPCCPAIHGAVSIDWAQNDNENEIVFYTLCPNAKTRPESARTRPGVF